MEAHINRCSWVNLNNPLYIKYHDLEWGKPSYNDDYLFEMLVLEIMQAGLAWETVLKKRQNFKEAFDNFKVAKIANYDSKRIESLMKNKGIIRHQKKIEAIINNAKIFEDIQDTQGSFGKYIWSFTNNKIIYHEYKTYNDLAIKISKDLQKQGMKFVGKTIIYSYLQAIGIINDHEKRCFCYKKM